MNGSTGFFEVELATNLRYRPHHRAWAVTRVFHLPTFLQVLSVRSLVELLRVPRVTSRCPGILGFSALPPSHGATVARREAFEGRRQRLVSIGRVREAQRQRIGRRSAVSVRYCHAAGKEPAA